MAAYADIDYYRDIYGGSFSGTDAELQRLLQQASFKIDTLTFNRVRAYNFDSLSPFQQENIRQSCCFQADYLADNGTDSMFSDVKSYTVLDISVTTGGAETQSAAAKNNFSETGYQLLAQTGLMTRIAGCI